MDEITNYEELANAIILQAVKDYRRALKCLKTDPGNSTASAETKEIEEFFRSDWFSVLTSVDGEMLIHSLKMEVGA